MSRIRAAWTGAGATSAALLLLCCSAATLDAPLGPAPPPPTAPVPSIRPSTAERVRPTIAAGEDLGCAIQEERLFCWGEGNGTPEEVPGLQGVAEVSAFEDHLCALDAGGRVSCWRQGRGSPTVVAGLEDAAGIATGGNHGCALRSDQTVSCWGSNSSGQLGAEEIAEARGDPSEAPRARPVVAIDDAVAVFAGEDFSCAILEGGQGVCWGANSERQLGNLGDSEGSHGIGRERHVPMPIIGLHDALDLSLARRAACAVRRGGLLSCWGGSTGRGQLEGPRPVAGVADARQIVGALHLATGAYDEPSRARVCALDREGQVRCWARSTCLCANGECDCGRPRPVEGLPAPAAELASGRGHACARLVSGGVWCWGRGDEGQLGRGPWRPSFQPAAIPGLSDAVQTLSGDGFACALRAGGEVVCWGRPLDCLHRHPPDSGPPAFVEVPHLGPAAEILGRDDDVCARRRDGQVLCVHLERPGAAPPCGSPFGEAWEIVGLRGADDVDLVSGGYVGLLPGGRVRWAPDERAQLRGEQEQEALPVDLARIPDAVEVAGGDRWACVRRRTGEVACLGWASAVPAGAAPVEALADIDDATGLWSSGNEVFVTRASGETLSVRRSGGMGDAEARFVTQGRSQDAGAAQVADSGRHRCSRSASGDVRCSGQNEVGQSGPGGRRISTPTAVPGVQGATFVSVGPSHSCAVASGGQVLCWGSNALGVLGSAPSSSDVPPGPVLGLGEGRAP